MFTSTFERISSEICHALPKKSQALSAAPIQPTWQTHDNADRNEAERKRGMGEYCQSPVCLGIFEKSQEVVFYSMLLITANRIYIST